MSKKKFEFSKLVTPVGMAKLTFLDKPSKPFQEGGKEMYKVRVLWEDTPETREFVDNTVNRALEEAKKAGVKLKKNFHNPFRMPEDEDEDDFIPQDGKDRPKYDEDYRGKIWSEFKSAYKPGMIDTERNSLSDDVKIYGGDEVRVKVQLNPYVNGSNNGISFYLLTVQLVAKNTSFTGAGALDTDGFDDIDGYVVSGGEEDDDEIDF